MINILIDLNIIMDFFFNRPGHEKVAEVNISPALDKIHSLFTLNSEW